MQLVLCFPRRTSPVAAYLRYHLDLSVLAVTCTAPQASAFVLAQRDCALELQAGLHEALAGLCSRYDAFAGAHCHQPPQT